MKFTGRARVFDSEALAIDAIMGKKIEKGDVVIIRYEGPKGGPGMPEMLSPTSLIAGMGLSDDVALITDGRFLGQQEVPALDMYPPRLMRGAPSQLSRKGMRSSSIYLGDDWM